MTDLHRFLEVHGDVQVALDELRGGRKRTHWMWYVFPQAAGLGRSAMAQKYAIADDSEATAFLVHPVLGADYVRTVEEVWRQVVERGVTIHDLFGSPDDLKLVSSLTLFAGVAEPLVAERPGLATFVAQAADILAVARSQGLPTGS